jgi:hypothetical protein
LAERLGALHCRRQARTFRPSPNIDQPMKGAEPSVSRSYVHRSQGDIFAEDSCGMA